MRSRAAAHASAAGGSRDNAAEEGAGGCDADAGGGAGGRSDGAGSTREPVQSLRGGAAAARVPDVPHADRPRRAWQLKCATYAAAATESVGGARTWRSSSRSARTARVWVLTVV